MGFEFYILLGFFVVLFSLGLVGMALSVRYKHTPIAQPALPDTVQGNPEAGNVFFAIFGALALVGILGAATMTFMKGPLSSAIKLTKLNTAEVQMTVGSQVAVMSTTSQANSGDCDSDGFVEPMDWRAATTEPIPTNGGLIPLSLGISKKDPWGTEYGYCVWNHGPTTSGGTCGANMLTGTNSTAYPVVALVSAGPDKAFTTTCRSFASADGNSDGDLDDAGDDPLVSKAAETDDDVIHTFTYEEATAASGGLWSLKSGDPATAVIDKKIETTGTASFQGGILLPDKSLITCDATTAGVMARNASGNGIEICDGSAWTTISGGGTLAGNGLVLSPVVSSGMNVAAGCGSSTCYSSNVTFVLQNNLTVASDVLATSLSNTANFEFVSNNCNVSLAAGANCQMVVRAKASGNMSYASTLNVIGNNSPLATLDGTATGFAGCNAGGQGPGGYYLNCGGTYNLIVTPSGCTGGNTNPICAGGNDVYTAQAGGVGVNSVIGGCCTSTNGLLNTTNLMAYSGGAFTFNAASYCAGMVYQGYDDWYLPSSSEISSYLYPLKSIVGGTNANYWTSNEHDVTTTYGGGYWIYTTLVNGSTAYAQGQNLFLVRCMRRDPTTPITPTADSTPAILSFDPSYGAPAETRTSNPATIYGVTSPVSISISGAGAQYSKNGEAYTSAAGTATNGDSITLQATSPAIGQESIVTLTAGTSSFNWLVRTPGNNTIRVFTTSGTYNGNIGGGGGADTQCTSVASSAGLPGSWKAVIGVGSSGSNVLATSLPWNWNRLKNMNGQTVAVSLTDFLDGTISAPMNYSQTGALTGGNYWSGLAANGTKGGSSACQSWATTSSGYDAERGDSSATTGGVYFKQTWGNTCNGSERLLCIETNAAGTDLDPNAVQIQPQVTFTSGGTGTSNTVTVTGVTDSVAVEIIPSAGTADIIKGGVSVGGTTTTAGLNETLAFTLEAPVTIGTKNTATITIGPDTYTWWVGYADSAREAKAFLAPVPGAFGGLAGGDNWCNSAAAASPLGLSSSWKAVLSSSVVDASSRIPWNWGTLKTVDGAIVVDGGFPDLWDGSLDGPINKSASGATTTVYVHTGTTVSGVKSSSYCNDWTSGSYSDWGTGGNSGTTGSTWVNGSGSNCNYSAYVYCIEDVDNAAIDTTPSAISLKYAIQVPVSSRQASASVVIGGMSTGATATLSVSATSGDPKFTVNGGGEVSSASVQNGDVVVFKMDAPATGNSSNKMTITADGSTTLGYWRVWTGDTTGSAVKRVFVYNKGTSWNGNMGSLATADTNCTSAASSAGLGGTWKAIISGQNEPDYAVNRIGYDWTTLRRTDGVDVVLAGNIWSTATTPLLNPITKDAANANTYSTSWVLTNTDSNGNAVNTSNSGTCNNWTWSGYVELWFAWTGTSGVTNDYWIRNSGVGTGARCDNGYNAGLYYYCIEQ